MDEGLWVPFPFEPSNYVKELGDKEALIDLSPLSGEKAYIETKLNDLIKDHVDVELSSFRVIKIQKVINMRLWRRYKRARREIEEEAGRPNELMMFHGSPSADEIVRTGFCTKRANPRSMFGAGIYFSVHSSKSNQYVFNSSRAKGCSCHGDLNCGVCVRKMLLCRVLLGTVYKCRTSYKMKEPPQGYHSVAGVPSQGGLRYPEYVVYRGEQVYPEYLITYTINKKALQK